MKASKKTTTTKKEKRLINEFMQAVNEMNEVMCDEVPYINYGGCGNFAYAFYKQAKKVFKNKCKIVAFDFTEYTLRMVKDAESACHHIMIMIKDLNGKDYCIDGHEIMEFKDALYENGENFVSVSVTELKKILERRHYWNPRYRDDWEDNNQKVSQIIDRHMKSFIENNSSK